MPKSLSPQAQAMIEFLLDKGLSNPKGVRDAIFDMNTPSSTRLAEMLDAAGGFDKDGIHEALLEAKTAFAEREAERSAEPSPDILLVHFALKRMVDNAKEVRLEILPRVDGDENLAKAFGYNQAMSMHPTYGQVLEPADLLDKHDVAKRLQEVLDRFERVNGLHQSREVEREDAQRTPGPRFERISEGR